jgi:hypothetical protein
MPQGPKENKEPLSVIDYLLGEETPSVEAKEEIPPLWSWEEKAKQLAAALAEIQEKIARERSREIILVALVIIFFISFFFTLIVLVLQGFHIGGFTLEPGLLATLLTTTLGSLSGLIIALLRRNPEDGKKEDTEKGETEH